MQVHASYPLPWQRGQASRSSYSDWGASFGIESARPAPTSSKPVLMTPDTALMVSESAKAEKAATGLKGLAEVPLLRAGACNALTLLRPVQLRARAPLFMAMRLGDSDFEVWWQVLEEGLR